MPPPPLTLVSCVLQRVHARLAPLAHVSALLTELLDASVRVMPPRAAASGSLTLFERVQRRVARDRRVDAALKEYWLARALQAAIKNDDLLMAQRVHAWHPKPFLIHQHSHSDHPQSTLALALRFGSLETVQWVATHRSDGLCCPPSVQNVCTECLLAALPCLGDKDPHRIFQWLVEDRQIVPIETERDISRLWEFLVRSVEVVRWLHERSRLSRHMGELVLTRAIEDGRAEIVRVLLAAGYRIRGVGNIHRKLIRAGCFGHSDVVEALLLSDQCRSFRHHFQWRALDQDVKAEKILRWCDDLIHDRLNGHETVANVIRDDASRSGNLRVLQWLYSDHGITPSMWHLQNHEKPEHVLLRVYEWMHRAGILGFSTDAIDAAARDGLLGVVRWLHAHTTVGCTTNAMDDAAANGHLHVLRWLRINRNEGCTKRALSSAARRGHVHVLQWLLARQDHLHAFVDEAKTHAAAGDHLEALIWLCQFDGITCTRCLSAAVVGEKQPYVRRWLHGQDRRLCQDCANAEQRVSPGTSSSEAALNTVLREVLGSLQYLRDPQQETVAETGGSSTTHRADWARCPTCVALGEASRKRARTPWTSGANGRRDLKRQQQKSRAWNG